MAQNLFGKTDSRGSTPVTYNFTPLSSAEPFSTSKPYAVGDYVFYEGVLYRCKTDKAAGAWAPTKFEEANLGEHLTEAEKALLTKAEIDGYYDGMTVGNAEQIVGTVFEEDDTAYNYRTTGGSAEVGDRAYVDAIVGGSLPWNQLANPTNGTAGGITRTVDENGVIALSGTASASYFTGLGSATILANHVYLSTSTVVANPNDVTFKAGLLNVSSLMHYIGTSQIAKPLSGINSAIGCEAFTTGTSYDGVKFSYQLFDLTAMFGSTIADYIYGLETAHAGAGVAWFKRYFPKPYYAYHAVGMEHVNAVAAKTVGFNQWDEEWEVGTIDSNGQNQETTGRIRSTNYIPIFGGATYHCRSNSNNSGYIWCVVYDANKAIISDAFSGTYYKNINNNTFTVPTNARYLRFVAVTTTYNHDICISIHWDNSRDGDYEPYNLHTYPLADLTLRGIPKKDESGNLYFDGDRYLPDGTVERRYGIVDLGTLTWGSPNESGRTSASVADIKNATSGDTVDTIRSSKYISIKTQTWYNAGSNGIAVTGAGYGANNRIGIVDSAFIGKTSTEIATALSGVYAVYELATPTTEEADPYQYPMVVDNWGTEELIDGKVESGDRDVAIPVGHETKYPPNLKNKLESAANNPDADGAYILTHDGGSNTYTPLASNPTIQNIIARLEALEGGGENE